MVPSWELSSQSSDHYHRTLTAEISLPDMNCGIAGTWNRRWISMWRVITHWSTSTMAWPVTTSCLSVGYEMPTASLKESRSTSYLADWTSLYVVSLNCYIEKMNLNWCVCTQYIHNILWILDTEHMVMLILCVFIRYKKNIKAFYIVHPTMFIRTVLIFFKPLIRSTLSTLHLCCKYKCVICKDLLKAYLWNICTHSHVAYLNLS